MVARVDDVDLPKVGGKILAGAEVIDHLADRPMFGHRDQVALHQAPGRLLGERQRFLDRCPVVGIEGAKHGALLVLLHVLDDRDRVVGLELAGDLGDLVRLKSVDQLDEYKEVFDNRLIDADPGWVTTEQNAARLEGYEIGFKHVTSGEAAQLAELKRAIQREEPIVTYNYRPHWVFAEYDLTQLEEPNPYEEGCFDEGGEGACAMPPYSAWTAARKDVADRAPAFYELLKQFEIPLEDMEAMLAKVDLENQEADAVATEWIEANQDQIDSWVAESAQGES